MKLLLENWRQYLAEEDGSCENNLVVFMAGGPGSGKGTVLRNLGLNLPAINPDDEFERELQAQGISMNMQGMSDERKKLQAELETEEDPEMQTALQVKIDDISSQFSTAMKTFNLANKNNEAEIENRINSDDCTSYIIDGTAASYKVVSSRVERLKAKGYKVAMVFVDVDPTNAEERNLTRSSQGGRSLPTRIIAKVHDKVQANRQAYAELFGDNFIYVDNKGSEEELKGAMKSSLSKLSQI